MKVNSKKKSLQTREESIRKSNEISMAELNQNLSLNQTQLLAYAIYSTQQDGKTEFQKYEIQKKFGIEQYRTEDAYRDSKKIMNLQVSIKDLERDFFQFTNVFMKMTYDKGRFIFEWHPDMVPHILNIKERYVVTDLEIASHFKSSFSWRLYEYLKAHYGYFRKNLSKEDALRLFNVQEKKSYQQRINAFKHRVLDVAIEEINKYTELEVWYKEQKKGRAISGFEIYWSTGETIQKATQKQMDFIQSIIQSIQNNMFTYINLDNEDGRRRAYDLVKKIESHEAFISSPINITSAKADEIIKDLKFDIQQLNTLVGSDKPKRDTSVYFNWIKGEE